jgi:hypothetical protein
VLEGKSKVTQLLKIEPADFYAVITDTKGRKSKHEFYYGSGYLSQSSRTLSLPNNVQSVMIYDFTGKSREVSLKFQKP